MNRAGLDRAAVDIIVTEAGPDGHPLLRWSGGTARCAIGRGGISCDKHEGDGATPVGRFPLRQALYRADRIAQPATALPLQRIGRDDGWCDDPADAAYNRPVPLPYAASHERLWRDDALYDILIVVGHNDDPVLPGRGSAIFIHVASADFTPTAGCVALTIADLQALLRACRPGDQLIVAAS